jgi:hypothetical protein
MIPFLDEKMLRMPAPLNAQRRVEGHIGAYPFSLIKIAKPAGATALQLLSK